MPEEIVSRILRLPGYGIYAWETNEAANQLTLSIRQTGREPYYVCGGCGISVREVHSWSERQIRDLPWGTWTVWLKVEIHRVRCRRCGVRTERLPFVEGKAHYTARLEAAVAQDCEAAPVSRVAAQRGLPPETVRRMDKRVLRRWAAARPRQPLRYLGVDEIFLGKTVKFLTVVSDLETGEPLWVGLERKRETLDRFFAEALPPARRRAVRAVCVDMWEPFRLSLQEHVPHARIVYDKFHVLRHASEAVDETRRAEFFRQGAEARGLIRGKRWLLLRRWMNLDWEERQTLRDLFALNRRLAKAYLLKEQSGPALDLHLRGGGAPLPHQLAPRSPLAAAAGLPEARPNVDAPSGRHLELLPREGPLRESRSDQRQHPCDAASGPGLPGPRIPPPQSPEGHRQPPPPSNRMNTGPATDSGEDRYNDFLTG